jgi:hypothetical protein
MEFLTVRKTELLPLCDLLTGNRVEHLLFTYLWFSDGTNEGLEALSTALRVNTSLTSLAFMDRSGVFDCCHGLVNNSNLRKLSVHLPPSDLGLLCSLIIPAEH